MGGHRRKKGGRTTPKGGAPLGRLTQDERARLDDIFERILRSAPRDLTDELPAVAVELWASEMWSVWAGSELVGADAVEVFAGGMINYAGRRATAGALRVLRALGAVAPEPYGTKARRAGDRLAAQGIDEPAWAAAVGAWQPTEAWLAFDPVDDDGIFVMLGFDGRGGPSTASVYVDHNLGGMAKDGFVVPAGLDVVLSTVQENREDEHELSMRKITLEEAAARWREALTTTDAYLDPPTNEEFDELRALLVARLSVLPGRGMVPRPEEMGEDERAALVSEFVDSDETIGLCGPEDDEKDVVEQLSDYILTLSLDYVAGTPLRFSPFMVKMFCLDWAPRKIAMDGDAFTLLPDVLAAWVRFAGRRRGIPESSIAEAVTSAYEYAPEMIELCQDSEVWGPAKTMALAMQQRGIDPSDQEAVDELVAEVNRQGGIDVLADSLAQSVSPKR